MLEPWQPNRFFLFLTVAIILLYCLNSLADPYEHCEVKKVIVYDGKEIVSAEIGYVCESKFKVDNETNSVVELQLPKEELPQVVSLTEFYNEWMN